MQYKHLHLTSLTSEQSVNRGGYFYLVTASGASHTAFHTKEALLAWLELTGLTVRDPLPAIGEYATTKLIGEYNQHYTPFEQFRELEEDGFFYALNNAQYTLGKFTKEGGIVTLHFHHFALYGMGYFFDYHKTRAKINKGTFSPSSKKIKKWFKRNLKEIKRRKKELGIDA